MEKFRSRLAKIIIRPFFGRKKQFKICKGMNVNKGYPRAHKKKTNSIGFSCLCFLILIREVNDKNVLNTPKLKMVFCLYTLIP